MIYVGNKPEEFSRNRELRIVSLVPSLTELLYYLGLNQHIVGVTRFCELPQVKQPEPVIIGGPKNPKIDRIINLNPTLVLASKEENIQEDIMQLDAIADVWVTDVETIEDNVMVVQSMIQFLGLQEKFGDLSGRIRQAYTDNSYESLKSVLYLIWQNPYMSVGGDTFIHGMLKHAGFKSVTGDVTRYPSLDEAQIKDFRPEYIFLSSEPYPFKQSHLEQYKKVFPDSQIVLVDGSMFSWYGIRPLLAVDYFKELYRELS
ncbi:MAG: ABC transporter substrate-binding protein [Saprospiraceae bacterium]|nr:ABC transporter substrate-binding protein [Saprospiraceae bacterium]